MHMVSFQNVYIELVFNSVVIFCGLILKKGTKEDRKLGNLFLIVILGSTLFVLQDHVIFDNKEVTILLSA